MKGNPSARVQGVNIDQITMHMYESKGQFVRDVIYYMQLPLLIKKHHSAKGMHHKWKIVCIHCLGRYRVSAESCDICNAPDCSVCQSAGFIQNDRLSRNE